MSKTPITIAQEINNLLPVKKGASSLAHMSTDPDYKDAIIVSVEDTYIEIIEGEMHDAPAGDYYGEFHGGYPWVCSKLEKYAEANNLHIEWESPAALHITQN